MRSHCTTSIIFRTKGVSADSSLRGAPGVADALALRRPYASRDELFSSTASALTQNPDEAAWRRPWNAHPRIGKSPQVYRRRRGAVAPEQAR